jgi:hypothetical protein
MPLPNDKKVLAQHLSFYKQGGAICAVHWVKLVRDVVGRRVVSSIVRIADALQAAGVEFIAENGGGAGVRLVKC